MARNLIKQAHSLKVRGFLDALASLRSIAEIHSFTNFFLQIVALFFSHLYFFAQLKHRSLPASSPTAAQCTHSNISPPFQLHFTMHFSDINLLHIFCCSLWYQGATETGSNFCPNIKVYRFSRTLQILPRWSKSQVLNLKGHSITVCKTTLTSRPH